MYLCVFFVCVACCNYKLKHSSRVHLLFLKLIEFKQKNALNLPAIINKKSCLCLCVGVCVKLKRKSEQQWTIA